MRNIYLVTHPEATHHVDGLVGGWFDSALTPRGAADAARIAEALAELTGGDADIATSDLRRAWETADVIGQVLGCRVREDADLREKSFGEAEGRPTAWLRERALPLPASGDRLRHDEGIPGAETRWDLAQRCYRVMDRLAYGDAEHQVVVTHGGPTTFLITAWIGAPLECAGLAGFPVARGSITWLRANPRNGSHEVVRLGGVGHLLPS